MPLSRAFREYPATLLLTLASCYSVFPMKNLRDILLPVISDIRAGRKATEVSELWGASKALFLSGLWREANKPLIIVTATEEEAEALVEDLKFFAKIKTPFTAEGAKQDSKNPPQSPFSKGGTNVTPTSGSSPLE